ncbi:MAG: hypothetical protein SO073_09310 [Candidatus Onthomonas sp.]|nr:hypothetical protein [Candidatus Onthomonas sp.]
MKDAVYEAATLYDFTYHMKADGVAFPVHELVVDLDQCGLGFCRCEDNGSIALLDSVSLPVEGGLTEMWLRQLREECQLTERLSRQPSPEVIQSANEHMWNYYRADGQLDREALSLLGGDQVLLCSQLDQSFAPARDTLCSLLERGLERLEQLGLFEDDLRILAVGSLAACAPVQYTLRSQLTFDPFLPDRRFVALGQDEHPGELVSRGQRIYEQSRTVGMDVLMECVDDQGLGVEPIRLAASQQLTSTLEQPVYSQPVFVSAGDQLRFQIGGKTWSAKLPYDIGPMDGDLIEAACQMRDNRLVILIRRTLTPTRVYEIVPEC